MKIQKLKSGSETYYSCDLLNQSHSIESFSNVSFLEMDQGKSATTTNNIVYYENDNEFILESFDKIDNTLLIIEEDIFGNKKAWIKDSDYSQKIMDNIKNNNIISLNVFEDILITSLRDYYKDNKLNISIVNGLSNAKRKEVYKEINPEEMLNSFVNVAIKEDLKFNIEDSKCKVIIPNDLFLKIKEEVKNKALNVIKVKDLLRTKASSLNDLITNPKIKIKNKM